MFLVFILFKIKSNGCLKNFKLWKTKKNNFDESVTKSSLFFNVTGYLVASGAQGGILIRVARI